MKATGKLWEFYFKNYKKFIVIPIIILCLFGGTLIYQKITTGEFIKKDFSLKGGVTATFYTQKPVDTAELEKYLQTQIGYDVSVRDIRDLITGAIQGYTVVGDVNIDMENLKTLIEIHIGETLTTENYSTGRQSSSLGEKFFSDAQIIFAIAFSLMAGIVFYYFRNPVSALSIVISTLMDIVCVLGFMNFFGFNISIATIGAVLMIIGYSTDSDIFMSTYMWKRKEGTLSERMKQVAKTEATMFVAAFVAFGTMYLFSTVEMIKHIALVLLLGLIFDVIDTWLGTAALQRAYWEKKEAKK